MRTLGCNATSWTHCFTLAALPVVTLTSNRANVDKVYTATLNCTATGGIPQMYTYTWMHDGKVLQSETSSILTGVDETKLGNYTCVVENLAGTAINSIVIHQRLPGERQLTFLWKVCKIVTAIVCCSPSIALPFFPPPLPPFTSFFPQLLPPSPLPLSLFLNSMVSKIWIPQIAENLK